MYIFTIQLKVLLVKLQLNQPPADIFFLDRWGQVGEEEEEEEPKEEDVSRPVDSPELEEKFTFFF